FLRLFDGSQSRLPRDGNETIGLACLAAACCALGDRDRARSLYAALLPYAERNVHTARLSACFGPAGLFLGQLARLLGKHAEAKAHLERAVSMSQRMGFWPWLARAEFEYSQLLMALRDPEFADKAAALDGHARTLAREYDQQRLLERMSQAPTTRPAGLTVRESEILALLSGGLTSHEISERLVLSIHTVNRHVANIYAKIGARGRAEATAFAFRHGVVGDA
ncbi:MAG: LuxR C-terminal-related transcriptional regulator, partial [Chloroflexota bacterium]